MISFLIAILFLAAVLCQEAGMRTTLPTAKISSHTAHGPPAVLTPISFNDSVIVAADSPRQRDHIFENIRRAWNDALPNVTNLEAKIFKDVAYVDAESPKGALLRSIQYTVSGMAQQVVSGEKARAKFREVAAKTPIQGVWSIAGANRMTVNGSFASLTDEAQKTGNLTAVSSSTAGSIITTSRTKRMQNMPMTSNKNSTRLHLGVAQTISPSNLSSPSTHVPAILLTPISFNDSIIVVAYNRRQRNQIFENISRVWNDALPNVTNLRTQILKDVEYSGGDSPKVRAVQYIISGKASQVVDEDAAKAKFRELMLNTPVPGVWRNVGSPTTRLDGIDPTVNADGNSKTTTLPAA